jgi:hypothetical protein
MMISRLKREWRVTTLDLPQLSTSQLSIEEAASAVTEFWFHHADL